jgi:hypothetical protein
VQDRKRPEKPVLIVDADPDATGQHADTGSQYNDVRGQHARKPSEWRSRGAFGASILAGVPFGELVQVDPESSGGSVERHPLACVGSGPNHREREQIDVTLESLKSFTLHVAAPLVMPTRAKYTQDPREDSQRGDGLACPAWLS